MLSPRLIAGVYAVFGLLATLLLGPMMPPLQNADESAHAFRASQVSHFGLLGVPIPDGQFGGLADSGLVMLQHQVSPLQSGPGSLVTRAMYQRVAWGRPAPVGYPNTAINPPFFYVPAALGDIVARATRVVLPDGLVFMRVATGVFTVMIGAAAILLAGHAALWFFSIMLLPMAMALSAAVSQDGPMLACTALAGSLLLYLEGPAPARKRAAFIGLCVLLAMIGMARSPYLAFASLVLAAPVKTSWRITGVCGIAVLVLAWTLRSGWYLPLPVWPSGVVSPKLQLLFLAGDPLRVPLLIMRTVSAYGVPIGRSFIGQLGWLDVPLPGLYHRVAWVVLGLSLLAAFRRGIGATSPYALAFKTIAIVGSVAGIALAQYLTWTIVGSPVIDSIQGRYLLPSALLVGVFVTPFQPTSSTKYAKLAVPILLFPIVSIATTVHAIILRYYL